MIARVWRGRVPTSKAAAYHQYLLETGLRDYAETPGNRGVQLLRRETEGVTEFLLISLWDSLEAIRQFAGDDYERARYYPKDTEYLLELEPKVAHYEVLN